MDIPGSNAPDSVFQPDAEDDFAALLRANDLERAGTVDRSGGAKQIDGTVVAVSAASVYVDIGYKTEGILPLSGFAADARIPAPGDKLRVAVKGRDLDGYYELTRQRTAAPKDYTSLEEAYEEKGAVSGVVTGIVKGGLTVDIGMRAFLPASLSGTRDAAEMERLIGQEIRVRITQLDLEGSDSERGAGRPDAIVDRRSVLEEEAALASAHRFSELAEGQVVTGTVRSLTEFGAFVDLGGADALLHISDMAWHRVQSPADVVSTGDTLELKVLKIDAADPVKRRIAVGLKQLQPHPWDNVNERFALGEKVRGTVTRDADFGSFVEIAPGIEGLIHISEMAWGKKVHKPSDVVKVGDQVEAVILGIDKDAKRMSLGLKQALGDPWIELARAVRTGSVVEGPVSSITKFGAFVTVAEGVEGLVHISEITGEKRLNHPSDVLRVGERVKATVLEMDREKRQLRLSIKQLQPTGLDAFLAEHKAGNIVSGRVVEIDTLSNTARVELGEGIVVACGVPPADPAPESSATPPTSGGPVDLSQLGSLLGAKWKTASEPKPKSTAGSASNIAAKPETSTPVAPGQLRSFRLTRVDVDAKKLEVELA